MNAANRVALNTAILYARMILTMGIALYSTRVVLSILGDIDYGIYNLIAGVIVMLSFLNTAMATSTQRFFSYNQGTNNILKQKEVFTNSFFLHVLIGLLMVICLEISGFFLFDGFLNIPQNRIESARIVYHYMAITVFFTVISVPFNALLIAHENMLWVAIVNIIQSLLKLGIALSLYFVQGDKLIFYGVSMASIVIFTFFLFAIFSLKKYPECTLNGVLKPRMSILKELGSFAGWNLFGALCGMSRNEGLAIILNIFFGTVVNAAYGIANQISSQLLFFSQTMLRALNPQIMKSEGGGDRERMVRLSMMASKFGFFLLSIFAIPIIFEMPAILDFWLKDVPEYTVVFCRLILIGALTNQLTIGLQSAMQAYGDIKYYQIVVGSVIILNLPLAYILLKYLHFAPPAVLISYIAIEVLACVLRLFFANTRINMSLRKYFKFVFKREVIPLIAIIIINFVLLSLIDFYYRFVITFFISFTLYILLIFLFGLEKKEKVLLFEGIEKVKNKFYLSSENTN